MDQKQINASAATLDQLIETNDPSWPQIQLLISQATNDVQVLPPDASAETLLALQITTRSPLGAIAYNTGGILIDHGWIRVLGAGSKRLCRSISSWNFPAHDFAHDEEASAQSPSTPKSRKQGALLVADDVVGGFFAVNCGAFGSDTIGNVWYFAPDTNTWEDMDLSYLSFLSWLFSGQIALFYKTTRFTDWQRLVAVLPCDRSFNFFPPLFTSIPDSTSGGQSIESDSSSSHSDINLRSRSDISVDEMWRLYAAQ